MTHILYPEAEFRPLGPIDGAGAPAPMRAFDLIILHTMVGSLRGTDAMFHAAGWGGTESHLGFGYDGKVLQWTPFDLHADANLDANYRAISFETADWGEGPFGTWDTRNPALVPAWTPEQIESIAQAAAWCCKRFNIPAVLTDAAHGSRGISYHRKGINDWRRSSDEKWSLYDGKVCPGDKRVGQVPEVIARVNQILEGEDDDDMIDEATFKKWVTEVLNTGSGTGQDTWAGTNKASLQATYDIRNKTGMICIRGESQQEVYELTTPLRHITLEEYDALRTTEPPLLVLYTLPDQVVDTLVATRKVG
jgi:hypothetical protein